MTGKELSIKIREALDDIEIPLNIHKPLYDASNRIFNMNEEIDIVEVIISLMLEVEKEAGSVISELMTCLTYENTETLDKNIFANAGHIFKASMAKERILSSLKERRYALV